MESMEIRKKISYQNEMIISRNNCIVVIFIVTLLFHLFLTSYFGCYVAFWSVTNRQRRSRKRALKRDEIATDAVPKSTFSAKDAVAVFTVILARGATIRSQFTAVHTPPAPPSTCLARRGPGLATNRSSYTDYFIPLYGKKC